MPFEILHLEAGMLSSALVCAAAASVLICLASSDVKIPFFMSKSTNGSLEVAGDGVAVACAWALVDRVKAANAPVARDTAILNLVLFIIIFGISAAECAAALLRKNVV